MVALQEVSNANADIWGAEEHPNFIDCPTVNDINDSIDQIGEMIDDHEGPEAIVAKRIASDMGSLLRDSKRTMAQLANDNAQLIQSTFNRCLHLQSKHRKLTDIIRRYGVKLSSSRMYSKLNAQLIDEADRLELLGDTASHRALHRQLVRTIDSFDAYLSGLSWFHYAVGLMANRPMSDVGTSLIKSVTSANDALRKHSLASVDLSEFSLIVNGALNISDRDVKMSLVYGEEAFAVTNTSLLSGAVNRTKLTILESKHEFLPTLPMPMAVTEGMLEFIDTMNALAHQLKYVFSIVNSTLERMDQITDYQIGLWSSFTEKLS